MTAVSLDRFPSLPATFDQSTTRVIEVVDGVEVLGVRLVAPVRSWGTGRDAEVVEAIGPHGERLAAKLLLPDRRHSSDVVAAAREFRYGSVDHGPRIVRVLAHLAVHPVDAPPGIPDVQVLLMPLVEGPTLAECLDQRWARSESFLLRVATDMFEAIAVLADERVAIRDIKPSNVALSSDDPAVARAVLLDHGAARRETAVTTDPSMGTPPYCAPELLLPELGMPGPKVDVFSVGATLLHLATGEYPFLVEDEVYSAWDVPRVGRPRLDEPMTQRLRDVLRGALVKDPAARPDARYLLDVLQGRAAANPGWNPDVRLRRLVVPGAAPHRADKAIAVRPVAVRTSLPPSVDQSGPAQSRRGGRVERPARAVVDASSAPLLDAGFVLGRAPGNPLIRFSGANPRIMSDHGDRVLFSAAGVMFLIYLVYIVAALAAFAAAMGADWRIGAVLGLAVGTIMVAFDRSIIATARVNLDDIANRSADLAPVGRSRKLTAKMIIRFVIALNFAVAVGEPAALVVFGRDVDKQLSHQGEQELADRQVVWATRFEQPLAALNQADREAQTRAEQLQDQPDQLLAAAQREGAGTGPTGQVGCGPECRGLLAQQKAAIAALPQQVQQIAGETAERQRQRQKLTDQYAAERAQVEAQIAADRGFIAREKALLALLHEPVVLGRYLVMVFAMLVLELAGVLSKILAGDSAYERARALQVRLDLRNRALLVDVLHERNVRRRRLWDSVWSARDTEDAAQQGRIIERQVYEDELDHADALRQVELRHPGAVQRWVPRDQGPVSPEVQVPRLADEDHR